MQAEKILLETDQYGRLLQQPQLPPNVRIEAIFLLLEDITKDSKAKRKPSKKLWEKERSSETLKHLLSRLKIGKLCNDFNGYAYLAAVVVAR